MVSTLHISYWITLAIAVPAAGFLVRIFIIFHDCGHGSFFRSRRANTFWGLVPGMLTFTPYRQWRHNHAVHHASAAGVWLFYVQHRFEGVYWGRREHWDFVGAALQGSSFYKPPKVLQPTRDARS